MRIESRIKKLNKQLMDNTITAVAYKQQVQIMLAPLDWQKRIQFENLTLA